MHGQEIFQVFTDTLITLKKIENFLPKNAILNTIDVLYYNIA